MPFRDCDWEDFQRDCDFFPAYTDYIFGVDTRPEVEKEPGLHPQLFDPLPPLQRLSGLPPLVQYPAAYNYDLGVDKRPEGGIEPSLHPYIRNPSPSLQSLSGFPLPVQSPAVYEPALDASPNHLYSFPNLHRTSMLRQDSSMESMQRTPCPAPRALPATGSRERLLRPDELTTDPAYSLIPEKDRIAANINIVQAWKLLRDDSDAIPLQRMTASGYLKRITHAAAEKRQEWEAFQADQLQSAIRAEEDAEAFNRSEKEDVRVRRTGEEHYYGFSAPAHHAGGIMFRMDAEAEHIQAPVLQQHTIDLFQLPTCVQSQLPQLWTWLAMNAFLPPPTDPEQIERYQQAQQYWKGFRQNIPTLGLKWLGLVLDGMVALRQQGEDPMTVLQYMPSIESTLNTL